LDVPISARAVCEADDALAHLATPTRLRLLLISSCGMTTQCACPDMSRPHMPTGIFAAGKEGNTCKTHAVANQKAKPQGCKFLGKLGHPGSYETQAVCLVCASFQTSPSISLSIVMWGESKGADFPQSFTPRELLLFRSIRLVLSVTRKCESVQEVTKPRQFALCVLHSRRSHQLV
jgi:hypothetical protein